MKAGSIAFLCRTILSHMVEELALHWSAFPTKLCEWSLHKQRYCWAGCIITTITCARDVLLACDWSAAGQVTASWLSNWWVVRQFHPLIRNPVLDLPPPCVVTELMLWLKYGVSLTRLLASFDWNFISLALTRLVVWLRGLRMTRWWLFHTRPFSSNPHACHYMNKCHLHPHSPSAPWLRLYTLAFLVLPEYNAFFNLSFIDWNPRYCTVARF